MSRLRMPPLLQALRPRQWTKNLVVFAAFVFALGDSAQTIRPGDFLAVLWAAACFCLVAGGVYLINDVKDREQDRLHPQKRHRAVAAGKISIAAALITSAVCLGIGLAVGWLLSPAFFGVLLAYLLLQLLYNLVLRQLALVDLLVIAAGFVLRAAAGAVVIPVSISPWLLVCTYLLALFLALVKRRQEKRGPGAEGHETRSSLAQYDTHLLDQLIAIVAAATIVCYTIYTLSADTVEKFGTPLLALTLPFVLFGVFRYLDLAYRHERGECPEEVLLTDVPLLVNLALYGVAVLFILKGLGS